MGPRKRAAKVLDIEDLGLDDGQIKQVECLERMCRHWQESPFLCEWVEQREGSNY